MKLQSSKLSESYPGVLAPRLQVTLQLQEDVNTISQSHRSDEGCLLSGFA